MKLERNLIPILAIAAILLLAVPAVGMVVGMALASEPGDESAASAGEPELPPLELPPLPDKQYQPTDSQAQQRPNLIPRRLGRFYRSGIDIYTYEDGDRTVRVVLQDDLVLQKNSAVTPSDSVVVKGSTQSIIRKGSDGGQDNLPVFRSESGGGLMTLPGGVLLALDPKWDKAQVDRFFSDSNISPEQVSELGFIPNGFLVETEAGFPSLDLANSLASQDGVEFQAPTGGARSRLSEDGVPTGRPIRPYIVALERNTHALHFDSICFLNNFCVEDAHPRRLRRLPAYPQYRRGRGTNR